MGISATAFLPLLLSPVQSQADVSASRQTASETSAPRQGTVEAEPDVGDIIVTGARTSLPITALPLTVDVLGGDEFERQVAVSGSVIDAVAARLPAFSPTREQLSGMGESLRGRSPLFAINGVPQSTPIRDGSRDGHTIDPFFVDRVEVIYGSNALQGIGATGGVVNQVTVGAPRTDGFAVRSLIQATAQDGLGQSALGAKAAALIGWRNGRWDATVGGARQRRGVFLDGNGRRIGVDNGQGNVQDSDSWSVFGRVAYRLSGTALLELVGNRFNLTGRNNYLVTPGDRAAGLPTSSLRGRTRGDPAANRAGLLSLSLTESAFYGGVLTAQLFVNRTRDTFGGSVFQTFQDSRIDPSGQLFDQSVNHSRKLGGKISYERALPGFDDLVLIGGVDALRDSTAQTLLATKRVWVPETVFRSVAPFTQANLKLLNGFARVVGGLRYESVRLDVPSFTTLAFYGSRSVEGGAPTFQRLLKNGGVTIAPHRNLRAYVSYAEGYTIPDVGRILRAITQPSIRITEFLDLRPVVSNNRELGIEWSSQRIEASATYFWSSSKFGSLLVRNPDGFFDVVRQPVLIEGLELSAKWQTPLRGLSIGGAYAQIKGRTDTDDDGRRDADLDGANISPDRLNLFADWDRGPFHARAAMRHYFPRSFKGNDPRNAFAGYTEFDAQLGYRFGVHRVSLSVQNLTDRQFITYFSDTQGPTDNLRYFSGRGRTFTLGLSSRW